MTRYEIVQSESESKKCNLIIDNSAVWLCVDYDECLQAVWDIIVPGDTYKDGEEMNYFEFVAQMADCVR